MRVLTQVIGIPLERLMALYTDKDKRMYAKQQIFGCMKAILFQCFRDEVGQVVRFISTAPFEWDEINIEAATARTVMTYVVVAIVDDKTLPSDTGCVPLQRSGNVTEFKYDIKEELAKT